jgi:large repetitive protein
MLASALPFQAANPDFVEVEGASMGAGVPDGEVEDYRITINAAGELNFGDAPAPYPTLTEQNGAPHSVQPGFHLGRQIDAERNGQPDSAALGDDGAGVDDEDGVVFLTPLIPGKTAQVEVFATAPGRLDAWIDFAANGNWSDSEDQILVSKPLLAGPNFISFSVPASAKAGATYARFRFSREGAGFRRGWLDR